MMQTQQSSQGLLLPEETLHWKTPQMLQNFEEELMKQANHQRAVQMSTYIYGDSSKESEYTKFSRSTQHQDVCDCRCEPARV